MDKITLWNVWFPTCTRSNLVNAVRESNIPDDLKPAIYAKLSACVSAKTLENTILKKKFFACWLTVMLLSVSMGFSSIVRMPYSLILLLRKFPPCFEIW